MLIGVIADDFTGASDIAATLSKGLANEGGLRTMQYLGIPQQSASEDIEAGVIALKSRSLPASQAVELSLTACEWFLRQGCQQIVFKYCSTFDSTDEGNIGPVLDALAAKLNAKRVIVCPAFPAMGRTLYQGNLFVEDRPLNESGMEHHPVTPMKDADVRRILMRQAKTQVDHIGWQQVTKGSDHVRTLLHSEFTDDSKLTVVDAISEHDLVIIGIAAAELPLISGGSGIAMALPHNCIKSGKAKGGLQSNPPVYGATAILVGSCSGATRGQIAEHQKHHAVLALDIEEIMCGRLGADDVVKFIRENQDSYPLVYSSGDPASVRQAQNQYGQKNISHRLDQLFGDAARKLVYGEGIQRLVVGGGETSGAVVSALDLGSLQVGQEIDPGVPALYHRGKAPLGLALKSGNFGRSDFFVHALNFLNTENQTVSGQ